MTTADAAGSSRLSNSSSKGRPRASRDELSRDELEALDKLQNWSRKVSHDSEAGALQRAKSLSQLDHMFFVDAWKLLSDKKQAGEISDNEYSDRLYKVHKDIERDRLAGRELEALDTLEKHIKTHPILKKKLEMATVEEEVGLQGGKRSGISRLFCASSCMSGKNADDNDVGVGGEDDHIPFLEQWTTVETMPDRDPVELLRERGGSRPGSRSSSFDRAR